MGVDDKRKGGSILTTKMKVSTTDRSGLLDDPESELQLWRRKETKKVQRE